MNNKILIDKFTFILNSKTKNPSKEEAIDQMIMFNHRLLNIDLQAIALNYRKEVASLSGKPSFKIGFDYTIVGKGANNMAGTDAIILPTLGISVPLYRNKYRAMVQEVVYLSEAKANEKINQENMLEIIFENGWKDYRDASRRIDLFESQLQLAHKSIKILETDYMAGNKNFEEILRMERKVLSFDLELEKAISDKQAAISFLYYLMGK